MGKDKRQDRRAWGLAFLLVLGGGYALASVDWCGRWGAQAPAVVGEGRAVGPLKAGASKVVLSPPLPTAVPGYGPRVPEATSIARPLHARALVLEVGEVRLALVAVDLLLVPEALAERLRARLAAVGSGVDELWLVASHQHTSFGGYDRRWLFQLAGLGRHREAAEEAVLSGAAQAVEAAVKGLVPARLEVKRGGAVGLVAARTGETADERLLAVRAAGLDGTPLGQLVVLAAHPTLADAQQRALDADFPGALAALREATEGVTLVVQGAGGNASVLEEPSVEGQPASARVEAYARRWSEALNGLPLAGDALGETSLAFRRVRVSLPRPDASRLVPRLVRAVGDNVLCSVAPRQTELSRLQLGPVALLAVALEPSADAGRRLEAEARVERLVSLVGGYAGYLEAAEAVTAGQGEARRQYYGPGLEEALKAASRRLGEGDPGR